MNKRSYPAYSMGVRLKINTQQTVPGPGAYNQIIHNYSPSYKIGKSQRKIDNNQSIPGPGAYSVPKMTSHQVIIASKPTQSIEENIPGPGAYDPNFTKLQKNMPNYSINNSNFLIKKSNKKSPGPNEYNINLKPILRSSGRTIFGTQLRLSRNKFTLNTPGPGAYHFTNSKIYQHQKYGIIGKDSRSSYQINSIPGPGQYNLKTQIDLNIEKKKGYHLGIRNNYTITQMDSPGPGQYHEKYQQIVKRNPSYSIQRAKRKFIDDGKDTSAQRFYGSKQSNLNKTGNKIGRWIKNKRNIEAIPGPGSYDIPSYISNLPGYKRYKSLLFRK